VTTARALTTSGLFHPEWVAGRRLWMDALMRDLLHKISFGDPVKGWEGDENLAVYYNEPEHRWELWRLEDDGNYRFVCRSDPDAIFDDRVIDALLAWDRRRRTVSLHDEIVAHNDKLEADQNAQADLALTEEVGPRLRHAFRKEADW
jgi:hypothetical protein